jgi:hypothetical protein
MFHCRSQTAFRVRICMPHGHGVVSNKKSSKTAARSLLCVRYSLHACHCELRPLCPMLKKASEFVPKGSSSSINSTCPPRQLCTQDELTFHKVWEFARMGGFHLPQCACKHEARAFMCPLDRVAGNRPCCYSDVQASSWEVYNMDMAGCTQCGEMHICRLGSCPVEKNDEGHDICTITGVCVKMLNFSAQEYIDHAVAERGKACFAGEAWGDGGDEGDECEAVGSDGGSDCSPFEPVQVQHPAKRRRMMTTEALDRRAPCGAPGVHVDRGGSDSVDLASRRWQHQPAGPSVVPRAGLPGRNSVVGAARCSVNKKNRYRSWVYQRVTSHAENHHHHHLHQSRHRHASSARRLPGMGCAVPLPSVQQPPQGNLTLRHCNARSTTPHHPPSYRADADNRATGRNSALPCGSLPIPPRVPLFVGGMGATSTANQQQQQQQQQSPHLRQGVVPAHGTRVHHPSAHAPLSKMDDSNRVSNLIQRYVDDVLCSTKWKRSMRIEAEKMAGKKRAFTAKGAKAGLSNSASAVHTSQGSRVPRVNASDEERKAVSRWCADAIHKHICLINSICKGVITEAKLRSTAIGLLYMIRQGIVVHELVVLPRVPLLATLLPLESHLDATFQVKAKCITETENVVKIILRNVSKQQLIEAGVARVSCWL